MVHLGKIIEAKLSEIGMTKAEFGRRIGTSRQNVSLIIGKESFNTEQLAKICEVLRYDFFDHIERPRNPGKATPPSPPKTFLSIELPTDAAEQVAFLAAVEKVRIQNP